MKGHFCKGSLSIGTGCGRCSKCAEERLRMNGAKDDLVTRCKELIDWKATGLLNGGSGGAVRELAKTLEFLGISYVDALSLAEKKTYDEAMQFVIANDR